MESNKPLVSVIVPNYNHEKFIKQRLDSILNQTYINFEVILLDDCSTDSSREILVQYSNNPKVSHCVFNDINSGSPFKQWKKGINLAKGEYIWIAESDDYSDLSFLDKNMQQLSVDRNFGIAYCQTIDINEHDLILSNRTGYTDQFCPNIWEFNFFKKGRLFVKKYLSFYNVIPNASAVVFKKTFVDETLFCESLLEMRMCGDWFFWIQLSLKTQITYLAEPLNYFRNHTTVTRNHKTSDRKKQRLMEESQVRTFLQENNILNVEREYLLYINWFKFFKMSAVFSSAFYKIKLRKTSYIKFYWFFFLYKFKSKSYFSIIKNSFFITFLMKI
ncbi:glycosyltransferase family 2 protein [Flavobacterium piscisymbiosum]|uniref:Glycosyltransferase family 2 protein n=1 Tax=Flavobacterium piscisymbiosum TaxID=2893753 RepID=A0ABS8M884_9FLAO|nr:glycosyltransferase family 2 protein [Flavobacterium sp. F-30]MCC9061722.1 glycosyltransferase family 2 protein [Flavobacterium sp. F-30]